MIYSFTFVFDKFLVFKNMFKKKIGLNYFIYNLELILEMGTHAQSSILIRESLQISCILMFI